MKACPKCHALFSPKAIAADLGVARCHACGEVVDLRVPTDGGSDRPSAPMMATPARWRVDEGISSYDISWSWFEPGILLLIPFSLFWNGALLFMAVQVSDHGQHLERLGWGLLMPHTWVGLGLVYLTIASFLNRTTVRVEGGILSVRTAPLPWPGNVSVEVAQVRQLFVVEHGYRGRNKRLTYDVCAVMADTKNRVIVRSLNSVAEARFLEAALERHLRLVDQRVVGEITR